MKTSADRRILERFMENRESANSCEIMSHFNETTRNGITRHRLNNILPTVCERVGMDRVSGFYGSSYRVALWKLRE